ncbi:HlyD family secretion protein [Brevibacillus marinus]|uniref:HlyD family secretion protein n=1 Tax=Brevibacillus marinus TaxID=2496837 RepID=UPI001F49EE64|nr:HlyD family efflux transporter periplasmic adaptor subunit [Brevibacillus marinus]
MHLRMVLASTLILSCLLTSCAPDERGAYVLSGTIEAEELPIVAEVGGMVRSIQVEEGDLLRSRQVLAVLDDSLLKLQVEEAEALLEQAAARLEEAKAGTREQTVQKAVAAVRQATANVQQAEARRQQAGIQVSRAEEQLQQVLAQWEGAKRTLAYQQARLEETAKLYEQGGVSQRDYEAQQEVVSQAQTQVEQLAAQVAAQRSQVAALKSEAEAAEAQWKAAQAQAGSASAELDLLVEGSTSYTIKSLIAAEKQARAKLEAAKLQQSKATLYAPSDGILLRTNVSEGEVVKAGTTLFTMMKKDELKLTVYIPEADLNRVQVGQSVEVAVDAYPGRRFAGVVRTISDKAEFTPKNVQTKEERTKLVFAVTIQLTDGLDALKPGMPADVFFPAQEVTS